MTENFGAFVAEAFEFIVGGMLLLGSVVFVILWFPHEATVTDDVIDYLGRTDQGLLVGGIAIGLAYVAGVIGEGGAHKVFEWKLSRVTWAHHPFREALLLDAVTPKSTFDPVEAAVVCDERERQRTYVLSQHPRINNEVESQLKRLRIERLAALATALLLLGFLLRLEWRSSLLAVLLLAYLYWLVGRRFTRYCSRISTCYTVGAAKGPEQRAGDGGAS